MQPGQTLAHYSVVEKIGQGGMGEVYRAQDTKLRREVALKLLPIEFTDDPERMARFEREARSLAALQHPNIATIYGLENADGRTFLAMELVEGEDLSQRLARGPMTVPEALSLTAQVAAGLEEAHEHGLIHRDLKPANVMVRDDGQVKILDFGLAKAYAGDALDQQEISASPTLTAAMTGMGVILGTAAYMSPEQARARPVDRRADIWALGVILFEALTGRRLFSGETVSDTLAAVLRQEPDWDALPADLPAPAKALLRRCLDRDPRRRLRDAGEVRIAFERPEDMEGEEAAPPVTARRGRPVLWLAALVVGVVAAAGAAWLAKPVPESPLRKLELGLPREAKLDPEFSGLAISPDGNMVAYLDRHRLWIRRLDEAHSREVPDSEGAGNPCWSPDSRWLGFSINNVIWKVPHEGGQPIRIGEAAGVVGMAGGLAWLPDDRIYITGGAAGIDALAAAGGKPVVVCDVDHINQQDFHDAAPLPDGRGILLVIHRLDDGVSALGVWDHNQVHEILHLPGERLKRPCYSPSGHIIYTAGENDATLWALPFDLENLAVTGERFVLVQNADVASVSDTGDLCFLSGGTIQRTHEMVLLDRAGETVINFGTAENIWPYPALSATGREALAASSIEGIWDVWLFDDRGARVRLTDTFAEEDCPVFTPDGQSTYFPTGNSANWRLVKLALDGTTPPDTLQTGAAPPAYTGCNPFITPDGSRMLYSSSAGETGNDIYEIRLDDPNAQPEPLLVTKASEMAPALSPDGNFLAYMSDVPGHQEVFLARYPSGAGRRQVSVDGGGWPKWREDGRELYYISQDSLTVVDVELGDRPLIGTPRRLFSVGATVNSIGTGLTKGFDVSADGTRFLVTRAVTTADDQPEDTRAIYVSNWFKEFEGNR